MSKLYEFAMPLTAKTKNLLLIRQNLIFLKIDILAKTKLLYCITLLYVSLMMAHHLQHWASIGLSVE